MSISRRQFLTQCGAVGLGFIGLRAFLNGGDSALSSAAFAHPSTNFGYGDLIPDPNKIFDLPRGFSYQVISRQGEEMSDGLLVPGAFDGMCAFAGGKGKTILVRNHEIEVGDGAFGPNAARLTPVIVAQLYDVGKQNNPGAGGTTTVVYNPKTAKVEKQFLSLGGTHRNCAGGPTPWGSWISCEETTARAGDFYTKDHGYNFEVPARADGVLHAPIPLREMGRFRHEAIAVGAKSGVVYQTEDREDGLIYRFIPHTRGSTPQWRETASVESERPAFSRYTQLGKDYIPGRPKNSCGMVELREYRKRRRCVTFSWIRFRRGALCTRRGNVGRFQPRRRCDLFHLHQRRRKAERPDLALLCFKV